MSHMCLAGAVVASLYKRSQVLTLLMTNILSLNSLNSEKTFMKTPVSLLEILHYTRTHLKNIMKGKGKENSCLCFQGVCLFS